MPSLKVNNNKLRRPIINFRNSGWDKCKEITDKHASKIIDALNNITDVDKLESKIYGIDLDIQIECFGITWERPFKKKKVRKKNSKELNEIYKQRYNELEDVLNDDFFKQDLYQRIYKLKNVINGPKVEAPEPTAINDPITGELITDNEEIKRVSLEHNVKIML